MTKENAENHETNAKPWGVTLLGLILIAGLILMPFVFGKPEDKPLSDNVRFIGHFHPVVLHLPIGIFSLILFQEIIAILGIRKSSRSRVSIFVGAMSSVVAATFGFFLYRTGGYESGELLQDHLWGGIIFACAAVLTWIVRSWPLHPFLSDLAYRLMVFGSVGIMTLASHDGASITHGEDYLVEYAPNPIRELLGYEPRTDDASKPVKSLEEQVVYAEIVQPILNKRCVECHKEGKSKGRLRMDTYELLLKGGKEGNSLVPGDVGKSNIVYRCELPEDDDEHMPPEGKTDITDDELAVIKWWIQSGADPVKKVGDLELPDAIRSAMGKLDLGAAIAKGDTQAASSEEPKSTLPTDALLKSVAELGNMFPGGLTFESQQSSNLTFTGVSLRSQLDDALFAKLSPVISHMVAADLSSTSVTDASVKLLAGAKNLRMVRLSETKISDAALDALSQLKHLESLNLYGTRVTDAGVEKLKNLPSLKRLYLWKTDVSDGMKAKLKEALPSLEIISGI